MLVETSPAGARLRAALGEPARLRAHPRHRTLPLPRAASPCRTACARAGAAPGQRADRRHAPGRARAPGVRRRRDRLPAGAARRWPTAATAAWSRSSCPGTRHAAPERGRALAGLPARRRAAPRRRRCRRDRRWTDARGAALGRRPTAAGSTSALRRVAADPARPAGRCPRRPPASAAAAGTAAATPAEPPGWTADDAGAGAAAGRAARRPARRRRCAPLYRYGDAAERRAVLRALPLLPVGATGVPPAARRAAHQRHPAGRRGARPVRRGTSTPRPGGRRAQVRVHGRAAGRRRRPRPSAPTASWPRCSPACADERTRRRPDRCPPTPPPCSTDSTALTREA